VVFFISGYHQDLYGSKKDIEIYPLIYIIIYINLYIMRWDVAKVLLSIPDEELEKIDDYRNKRGIKRNQFFMDAVKVFFQNKRQEEYFYRRRKTVESIKQTSNEIMGLGIKDWDPAKELRKARDERAKELLKRWDME
jgi:hypothetical protein